MRKIINYMKSNIWIVYVALFAFMVLRHMMIQLGTGDDIWFLEQSKMGLTNFTKWRISVWTSRNVIEATMLILLNMNKWVWIILDSLMFVLIAHSIRKIVSPTETNDVYITMLIALIIILFPFSAFSEAGWYATTLNYVWPLAFGLYGLSFLTRIIAKEHITPIQKILVVPATVYATNQEQMCALFVGFYGLFIIYCFIKHIHIPIFVYVMIVISLLMLGFHAFCPGNANRKMIEIQQFYPEFTRFSVIDQFVLGIVSTISIGLVSPVYIVFFWNVALLYLLIKKKGDIKDQLMIAGLMGINLLISISDRFSSLPVFNQIWRVFIRYVATLKYMDYSKITLYLVIVYFIIFVFVNLFEVKKYLGNNTFIIVSVIFMAAFCSRVLLGFSASIFASGRRTFINAYFLIIIATLICLNYKRINKLVKK